MFCVCVYSTVNKKKTSEQINKKKVKQNKCHVKMFAYAHSPVHSYPLNLNAIDVTAIKKRLM